MIQKKDWEEDAREVLIEGLEEESNYLPTEWIKAVASLNDPETYEALQDYLIYGSNRNWTYEAIKYLPEFNLAEAVSLAWEEVTNGNRSHDAISFAPIAAEFGHVKLNDPQTSKVLVQYLIGCLPNSVQDLLAR